MSGTAHLIYGYIGSGKTTLARRLERERNAVRFSIDEWVTRLYGEDEGDLPAHPWSGVEQTMALVWPRCLELGLDVVLDFGFWAREQRDDARRVVQALGGSVRLYRVRCSDDTAWERTALRNLDPRGSIRMARATFDDLRTKIEPLGEDEPCIDVVTDQ